MEASFLEPTRCVHSLNEPMENKNYFFLLFLPKNLWCESESDCQGILSGELADLNIWSRRFSSDEMSRFTKCESQGEGDLLSWSSAQWDFYNVGSEDKNLQVWNLAHFFDKTQNNLRIEANMRREGGQLHHLSRIEILQWYFWVLSFDGGGNGNSEVRNSTICWWKKHLLCLHSHIEPLRTKRACSMSPDHL